MKIQFHGFRKKLLALVLALVMTLGLATVGANAALKDYSDADSIDADYQEAFAVMNAVGVFQGSDNKLTPTDKLTRAQAAKLIAYLDLGEDTAETLPAVQVFADVPATHWAAKYIAYCQQAGIIQGAEANKFYPDGELTGYAFGAYLLAVLGYDRNLEGITGADWTIKAASLMGKTGIGAGVDSAASLALTREQGAQYCFEALQATMVEYLTKGSTVNTSDGTSVTLGASPATAQACLRTSTGFVDYTDVTKADASAPTAGTKQATMELTEKLYGTKLILADDSDSFGNPADKWSYKGVSVGTFGNKDAAITYTADMTATADQLAIRNAIKDYNNYAKGTPNRAILYVNGYTSGATPTEDTQVDEATLAPLTGNGRLVKLYNSSNKINIVTIVDTMLGQVTAVNDAKKTISIRLDQTNGSNVVAGAVTLETDKGYGTYKKNDFVLVTATDTTDGVFSAGDTMGVQSVAAPTVVTGIASTKNSAAGTITLAGTVYKASYAIQAAYSVASFSVSSKYDATLYLDGNGYIVRAESGTASGVDKSIAVLDVYQGTNSSGKIVPMVKGVTSDGLTVNWESKYDNGAGLPGEADNTAVDKNAVYTYAYDDSSSNYVFTKSTTKTIATVAKTPYSDAYTYTWDKGNVAANTLSKSDKTLTDAAGTVVYLSDTTNYIFINNGKATVLTGPQDVKTGATDVQVAIRVVNNSLYATAVYVIGASAYVSASDSANVLFVKGSATGKYSATGTSGSVKTYNTYSAWINGEEQDNVYASSASGTGFYTVKTADSDGAYTLNATTRYEANSGSYAVTGPVSLTACANGILSGTVAGASRSFTVTDAKIVNTTGTALADIESVGGLEGISGGALNTYAAWIMYNANTGAASTVYIVAKANATASATALQTALIANGIATASGNVVVDSNTNFTVPAGAVLDLNGKDLTLSGTGTLTVNGDIINGGTITTAGTNVTISGGSITATAINAGAGNVVTADGATITATTVTAGKLWVGCTVTVDNLQTDAIEISGDDAESKLVVKTKITQQSGSSGGTIAITMKGSAPVLDLSTVSDKDSTTINVEASAESAAIDASSTAAITTLTVKDNAGVTLAGNTDVTNTVTEGTGSVETTGSADAGKIEVKADISVWSKELITENEFKALGTWSNSNDAFNAVKTAFLKDASAGLWTVRSSVSKYTKFMLIDTWGNSGYNNTFGNATTTDKIAAPIQGITEDNDLTAYYDRCLLLVLPAGLKDGSTAKLYAIESNGNLASAATDTTDLSASSTYLAYSFGTPNNCGVTNYGNYAIVVDNTTYRFNWSAEGFSAYEAEPVTP